MDPEDLIHGGALVLSGAVLGDDEMWGDTRGVFSPGLVRRALAAVTVEDGAALHVHLNSPGGNAWAGEEIRAMLATDPRSVTVTIEGIAASAASLLAMGADHIEITSGSFVMIHDPATMAWGNEAEMRRQADALAVQAQGYASVYAAHLGIPVEEARALMQAETWWGAEEAVAAGFAQAVVEDAAPVAAPVAALATSYRSAPAARAAALSVLSTLRRGRGTQPPVTPVQSAGPAGPVAAQAQMEGTPMDPEEIETGHTPATPQMSADEAVRQERERVRRINDQAAPFMASGQIDAALVRELVETGATPEAAGSRILGALAQSSDMRGGASRPARIVRDEVDTRREALTAALMRDYTGPGEQYRGLRLRSLAMELAGASGGFNDVERVRSGMRSTVMMGGAHGVSDFGFITADVMNRTLQRIYAERAHTWRAVTGEPIRAADFREQHRGKFGGDFELKKVEEAGAYERSILADEAEGLRVERYGRDIVITFEAVINDDMGAFDRIPGEFARASRNLESGIVWGIIRSNAALKSGGALFRTADKNLLGSGSAISAASVAAMRKLAAEQKAPGAKGDAEILGAMLDLLIVPQALELKALSFTAATSPSTDGEVNPYKATTTPVVEPLLGSAVTGGSDTAWYMASSDMPPIAAAYLDGYEAPTIQTGTSMNPDTVTMTARHIFGAAPTERRGIVKNPGA